MDKLTGLKSALYVDAPPFQLKKSRTTAQAKGIAYERKVAAAISGMFTEGGVAATNVRIGPWIEYTARSGRPRYAQPDVVIEFPDRVVLVEVKLTHRPDIDTKLHRFYRRLARMLYPETKVMCAQVFRNSTSATPFCPGLEALAGDWPATHTLLVNHR